MTSIALWPLSSWAELVEGAQLPDGSHKVGEHRYRAPGNMEKTMEYFKVVYPVGTYVRRSIADQPGIRAFHIANPGGKGFEGLNVYETRDEVRIFVIPEGETPKPIKKKVTPTGRKR
jgi:hypothetical protein